MAVNNNFRNEAYGRKNPLQTLAPDPIIAQRNPSNQDRATLGTVWVNEASNAYFVLTSMGGTSIWTAQSTGSATQASLEITGPSGTVLTVDSGDTSLGGNLAVTGNSTLTGNLVVNGAFTANGAFSISDASPIHLTTTDNVAQALYLRANGGTSETVEIQSSQGTGLNSVYVTSTSGGVLVEAVGSTSNKAINLLADAGGIEFDAVLTSAFNVVGADQDIQLNATGGSIFATATESNAGAITLTASGAAGTVALAGTGGISVTATNNAITVASGTGTVSVSADATANTLNLGTGAGVKTVLLGSTNSTSATTVQSGTGGISLNSHNGTYAVASGTGTVSLSADAANTTVNVATGAAVKALTLGSTNSTSATTVQSGTGALNVTATNGALTVNSGTGTLGISTDAAANTVNIATGAAAKVVTVGNTTASTTLALNTPTGTNVVVANGLSVTTAGRGLSLPGGLLVISGTGSPSGSVTAPIGSLYLRVDPAGATSRAYINTDGGTTWTNITCAA